MRFTEKAKALVVERCGGRCEVCAARVLVPNYHHRRPRGMGGTNRRESGNPANCLYLHPKCHEQVERDRARALGNGWLVRQADDPAAVPVLWQGQWVLLAEDGTVAPYG